MRTRLLTVLMAALATFGMQSPSTASTGGTADGGAHPNVGILFAYSDGVRFRCSGTLVSQTVVLTAGHCTDGVDGKVLISFDSVIAETEEEFQDFPSAANPDEGYTAEELAEAGFASGDAYTHPEYSGFTDAKNWNDLGVVELDEEITAIPVAEIAEVGTLDGIAKSALSQTLFTAVGYGTEVRRPESGPQKAPQNFPLLRRFVDMPGQKLTPQILQTNMNPNDDRGTGGTCTGDSGGPLFLNGEIVAVTSYGNNDKCLGVGGNQRVDIAVAQDWLAEFGV